MTLLQAYFILKAPKEVYVCMHAFEYIDSSPSLCIHIPSIYTRNAGVRGTGTPVIVCECLDQKDVPQYWQRECEQTCSFITCVYMCVFTGGK